MKKLLLIFFAFSACAATHAQTRQSVSVAPAKQAAPAAQPAPSVSAKEEPCGCELPLPEVLAVVNGVKITIKDVDAANDRLTQQVRELEGRVVEARQRELALQINSRLLEAEAKKRNISSIRLIEEEIIAKAKEPTEAEAQAFYEQNRARIEGNFKDVKGNIIDFLRDQRQREEAKKLAERLGVAAQPKVLVDKVSAPAATADRARVFATVNGEAITSGDVEDSLRPVIHQVQEQIYENRRKALDIKINDLLLEQEAQKRKITTGALIETEVNAKVPPVTEQEAQAFYNQNKDQINGDFAQVKGQLVQYLQKRQAFQAEAAFAEKLRQNAAVQTFLTPPVQPTYDISTDDQPTKGSAAAKVTIVEFTDFQCSSCAQAQPVIDRLISEYGDKVRLVVRDFPLNQHANAFKAAEAAEAAREQGKYWEYVALLFRNQSALGSDKLKEYASQLGLDRQKFDAALDSGRFSDKVQRDLRDGLKLGVNGTPTIFVNGRRVTERSYESLKAMIEANLKEEAKKGI